MTWQPYCYDFPRGKVSIKPRLFSPRFFFLMSKLCAVQLILFLYTTGIFMIAISYTNHILNLPHQSYDLLEDSGFFLSFPSWCFYTQGITGSCQVSKHSVSVLLVQWSHLRPAGGSLHSSGQDDVGERGRLAEPPKPWTGPGFPSHKQM